MSRIVVWVLVGVISFVFSTAQAEEKIDFSDWLVGLKEEALAKGISEKTFHEAFKGIQFLSRVIELDRKQPEFSLTLDQYLRNVAPERRVRIGRKKLAENRELLEKVSQEYGIPPQYIVAFWGIETDFGRLTGGYSVIAALATLAYDGRRSDFFRRQLMDALWILEEGHIPPNKMKGSWAGAMGQSQFMPSTFRAYAVDFDGDKRIDLWHSKADVFASAAHYLATVGWNDQTGWGMEVSLPEKFDEQLIGKEIKKSIADWQALGVQPAENGKQLPAGNAPASIIRPDDKPGTRTFIVFDNFFTILDWNKSYKFGVAVGQLSDRIAAP